MQDFHVALMSYADTVRYPNNKASHFINTLALPVEMKGNWSMGMEYFEYISGTGTVKLQKINPMFVCCKLVVDSFVGDKLMPLLRTLRYDENIGLSFDRVNYKRIEQSFINAIEVEIRNWEN